MFIRRTILERYLGEIAEMAYFSSYLPQNPTELSEQSSKKSFNIGSKERFVFTGPALAGST